MWSPNPTRTVPETLGRDDDERLCQARIHSRRICETYRIGQQSGKPLTVLFDRALREFMKRQSPEDIEKGPYGVWCGRRSRRDTCQSLRNLDLLHDTMARHPLATGRTQGRVADTTLCDEGKDKTSIVLPQWGGLRARHNVSFLVCGFPTGHPRALANRCGCPSGGL